LTVGNSACVTGIACWNNGESPLSYASISLNTTGSPIAYNGTVTLPAGVFDLDPESTGSVMVEWTAPSAGTYSISGFFSGLDDVGNTHPAEIILNPDLLSSTTPFSATGGIVTGDMYSFSLSETLSAGEVVDFEVDTGSTDGEYLGTSFDATISNISSTPEPSSFLLLGTGMLGVAFLMRKKLAY
jgi:hypothetical protein